MSGLQPAKRSSGEGANAFVSRSISNYAVYSSAEATHATLRLRKSVRVESGAALSSILSCEAMQRQYLLIELNPSDCKSQIYMLVDVPTENTEAKIDQASDATVDSSVEVIGPGTVELHTRRGLTLN